MGINEIDFGDIGLREVPDTTGLRGEGCVVLMELAY
jgi:hypothetical protein